MPARAAAAGVNGSPTGSRGEIGSSGSATRAGAMAWSIAPPWTSTGRPRWLRPQALGTGDSGALEGRPDRRCELPDDLVDRGGRDRLHPEYVARHGESHEL